MRGERVFAPVEPAIETPNLTVEQERAKLMRAARLGR